MFFKILVFFLGIFLGLSSMGPAVAQKTVIFFQTDEDIINGKRALTQGWLEEASYYFERALKKNNLSVREQLIAYNDLCVTYTYLGEFTKAIQQCETGLALKPNRWQTLNNLGNVFILQGDYQNALETFDKALKTKPGSDVLKFNRDIALQRTDQIQLRETEDKKESPDYESPEDYGNSSLSAGVH